MTFGTDIWAVDGNPVWARQARLQLQSATRSRHGVTEPWHLRARETSTPSDQLRVTFGSYVAVGQEENFQGSYFDYNVGDALTPQFAGNSTSTNRHDLLYVRVEDPTLDQVTWEHDPEADPVSYLRIEPDVGPNATEIPSNRTGEPIARVLVEAGQSTPQLNETDHVTDLRRQANPLLETYQESRRHESNASGEETLSTVGTWIAFPTSAVFNVDVPEWAVRMDVFFVLNNLRAEGPTGQANNLYGSVRYLLNGSVSGSGISGDLNADWYDFGTGVTAFISATQDVVLHQGTQIQLSLETMLEGGNGDLLRAFNRSATTLIVTFRQSAYYNDPA